MFSLTKTMDNGHDFYSKNGKIWIDIGKKSLCFDKRIKTKRGFVLAAIMKPAKLNEIANLVLSTKTKQSLKHVHDVLCHPNEERTRATAKKIRN